jgi:Aldehyde dehydrogenase family
MPTESLTGALLDIRRYYDTGATRLYSFRQQQLLTFKQTILKYETEITEALYEDLRKTPCRKKFSDQYCRCFLSVRMGKRSILLAGIQTPLSFYVFTGSRKREKEWLEKIQFGTGCVNNAAWQFTNHYLPFGGIGQSGIGAYHGKHSFDVFTHKKAVMKTPTSFDPAVKYPPLKGKLKLLKWMVG